MAVNLSVGSTGHQVKHVQEMLNFVAQAPLTPGQLGGSKLAPLTVDGIFGPKTSARAKEFQAKARLKADGIVGPHTGNALVASVLGSMTASRVG